MNRDAAAYTFWGLYCNGLHTETPLTTLAYLVGLVDSVGNAVATLETAKYARREKGHISTFDILELTYSPAAA